MPQLDSAFYPSQLFWLAVTFALLYFILAVVILPRLKRIQTQRADATQGRRQQAEQAAQRAEAALQNYEDRLAEHKEHAQNEGRTLRRQIDDRLKKQHDLSKQNLGQKIQQAEQEIAAFLPAGRIETEQAAITATQEIIRNLTGQEIEAENARRAIKKSIEEKAHT